MANSALSLPNTAAGQISDQSLEHMISVGMDAQINDQLDTTSACLMVLTYAQVCRELAERRRAMARMGLAGPSDHLRIISTGAA